MAWGPHIEAAANISKVRAMISMPDIDADTNSVTKPANITNLECSLSIHDRKLKWQPAPWPVDQTFTSWAPLMTGFVLGLVDTGDYTYQLGKVLNSMSMLSGGINSNSMNQETAASTGAGTTYGCLVPNTVIDSSVYIIAISLICIVVLMLVVSVYNAVIIKFDKRHKAVEEMPFEMLDYQVAVVEKMTGHTIAEPRRLAGYEYFWDERAGRSHCRRLNRV